MYKYRFDGYSSYTSKTDITAEQERGIANSQKPLPYWIVLPSGKRLDWREEWNLAERRTSAGYAVLSCGVRIKYKSSASPDYHKWNGHGSCSLSLVVRSEIPLEFEYESL